MSKQLKTEYRAGKYDIIQCFYIYLTIIVNYGGKDIKKLVNWQIQDMVKAIKNPTIDYRIRTLECLWNRSRRSGKTMCASILAVFYVTMGFRVRWFTANTKQMRAARMWFFQNPFFIKYNTQQSEIHIIGQEHILTYAVLASHGNVTGDEGDCLFFDEGGDYDLDLKVYSNYEDARAFLANSEFAHILHFSTPARYSALFEANETLEALEIKLQSQFIFTRDYLWCPWTKKERALDEAARNPQDPYFFQKNYLCLWVVYGGAVFNSTDYLDIRNPLVSPELLNMWKTIEPTQGGVDWNGEQTQHYLGLIAYTDKYIFVKDEIKFWGYDTLKDWHKKVRLELEYNDPFSNQYGDDALDEGVEGAYEGWDNDMKMERLRQIKKRTVILDKVRAPTLWRNLQEAAYDNKQRLPTLKKLSNQHGLDWLMHAMHVYDTSIYSNAPPDAFDDNPWKAMSEDNSIVV